MSWQNVRLACAIACGGCALASAAHAQTVRDSAGIRIVENARALWKADEVLQLSATPMLEIGTQPGPEYKLGRIRHVARLADGRILVADGASLQLRFYDARGNFIRAAAGKGTAPGELNDMSQLFLMRGDTIAIATGLSALSLYSGAGDFVGKLQRPRPDSGRPPPEMLVSMLANGTRVMIPLPRPVPRSPGTRWADSIAFRLVDREHAVIRDLGNLPYLVFEQDGKEPSPPWLSAIGVFTGSENRFYAGFGDQYAIRVYSQQGDVQSIIRRAWTPEPVTPERWDYWVVEWAKLWIKSVGEQYAKEMMDLRASAYADTIPAFSQFIVDRVGRLWVREAHLEDAIGAGSFTDVSAKPSEWSVFDSAGQWLGDVTMPGNFQPYDIGADYVAGKLYANKVATALIYALEPASRRRR